MSTGAKIAIGCAVAVVVAVLGVAAVLVGGAYWAKGKIEQTAKEMTAQQEQIEELQKKANAHPFDPPADGAFSEDRLLEFLEVRKRIFAVYEKHKPTFEAMSKREPEGLEGLKALGQVVGVVNEIRLAQAQALADAGMSEAEYRFFVTAVYVTLVNAEVSRAGGGGKASEVLRGAAEAAAQQAEAAADKAEQDPDVPDEVKQQLREAAQQARAQAETFGREASQMDVPAGNIEILRKHEAEIKKYAMTGLEGIGL